MSGYPAGNGMRGNGLAIAAMVLGLLSFVCLGPVMSVPAVVCGHMASGAIKRGEMDPGARGFALTGLILGYINIALFIIGMLIVAVVAVSGPGQVSPFIYME